ncbi:MAG TPA: c-type cytochrome [Candidatus Methylomirabilis sp.]|nr:c-type cytochrome [Candidatus Methylomirabilis sp.]
MRRLIGMVLTGFVITLFLGCEKKVDPVERGRYLVTIMGCHDCHTPKVPGPGGAPALDTKRLLSGHPAELPYPTWLPDDLEKRHALALTTPMLTAWAGPWGVSFAANLTPNKETGIAEWSEEAFIRAMRTGKHQGQPNSRDILPPMPWEAFKVATDEDVKAVWAYLRSLPAIKNQVPFPVPPKAQK